MVLVYVKCQCQLGIFCPCFPIWNWQCAFICKYAFWGAGLTGWELWFHWGINARIFSESCVAVFWSYSTLLLPVCGIAHLSSATPTTLLYQVCSLDIDILAKYLLCLFCCSFEIFSDRSLALSTQSADLWFCIFYIFGIHLPVINVLRHGTHLCPMVLSGLTWLSCPSILW